MFIIIVTLLRFWVDNLVGALVGGIFNSRSVFQLFDSCAAFFSFDRFDKFSCFNLFHLDCSFHVKGYMQQSTNTYFTHLLL